MNRGALSPECSALMFSAASYLHGLLVAGAAALVTWMLSLYRCNEFRRAVRDVSVVDADIRGEVAREGYRRPQT